METDTITYAPSVASLPELSMLGAGLRISVPASRSRTTSAIHWPNQQRPSATTSDSLRLH